MIRKALFAAGAMAFPFASLPIFASVSGEAPVTALQGAGVSGDRILLIVALALAGVVIVAFAVVAVNLAARIRSRKTQDEGFVEAMKAASQMANLAATAPSVPTLPPNFGDGEKRPHDSDDTGSGLPPAPANRDEQADFEELAAKCSEIGRQVDAVTGRKNNSKNVAELAFKISHELGYDRYESALFFMVGLVYDIGFLEIDKDLFGAQSLTEGQKYEIRDHVQRGLALIDFVPERYRGVFAEGILMHHENVDGSGYPRGVPGARIPYVARVLRVAESYVALISRRNYRDIFDKESAVDELKATPGHYDPKIVAILENII